ncbi:DUF7289 family protein [Halapricum desulfuricans]|uniref:Putative pilin/flagellin n=1 Tax=Halapricum desulfuricans TaxID=2841257 RepID=A0A897NW32_9EURY|nr:CARDB domain-containing protein [Halapricum desulfuricans]QSG14889.1 putative pilin/flagellin [Halapricum desulfuricans]
MRRIQEGSVGGDNRGVSEVLGTALLIGFVVTAAVLLLVMGGNTVEQVEEQNRVQSATQSFQQFASEIEAIRQSESESVAFELPDEIANDVTTESRTRITLYANGNASCTTGEIELQSLVYESADGDAVGYEFGGVWEQTGPNSSSMVRAPNIEYRDGRLAVSLSQMQTGMHGSSTIDARLNESESRRMTANLTRSLFVNKTAVALSEGPSTPVGQLESCRPQGVENITVVVENSRFATAWHNYALRNYDDRLVDVSPGEDTQVGSGDTVEITYTVQDTEFANFEVTGVDAVPSAPADEDVSVNTTVENTGDLTKTNDISFSIYKETASGGWDPVSGAAPQHVETERLAGGEAVDYEFTIPGDAVSDPGRYQYRIETGDDVYSDTIDIGDTDDDWPRFEITSLDAPDSAHLSGNPQLNVTVRNEGDLLGNQTIAFSFDGDREATRTVGLGREEEATLTFDIPTGSSGTDIPLNVTSNDDFATTLIDIGSAAYFDISEAGSPTGIDAEETFEINASITNTGGVDGTQSVEIRVQNASTGTVVDRGEWEPTLDGHLSETGEESRELTLTVDGVATPGLYNYTVQTGDENVTRTFYVGEKATDFFQVSSVRATPNPVEQGNTTTVTAVINNTGASSAEQTIEFAFADGTSKTDTVSLAPGSGTTVTFDYEVPEALPAGAYEYTVSTANSSATDQIRVAANLSGAFESGDDGQIEIDGDTTARLQVLGTEPTATSYDYDYVGWSNGDWWWDSDGGWIYDPNDGNYRIDGGEISRAPTVMDIVTENETAGRVEHNVWSGDDLNRPRNWERQVDRNPYFNRTVTVSEASSLWVSATTYGCERYGYTDTGLDRYVDPYGWFDRNRCTDWGSELVSTNSNQNTENVVILGDNETVPSWGSASPDQRSIGDILEDKFDPDTGRLNLEDDQLVMLFELTQPDADPDDADPSTSGDPDYNDAVVLFEVVNRTRTVKTPARLVISDLQTPAVVEEGETDTLRVEVTNRGGQVGSTDVTYHFDGAAAGSTATGELEHNESTWIEFDIPPNAGYDPGTYEYELGLTANPNQTRSGNVYVGSDRGPRFIVQGFERAYPRGVPLDSDASVTATVANVGDEDATMPVRWFVDGESRSSEAITLPAGESTTVTFDGVPTDETGPISVEATADNTGYDADNSSQRGTITVETETFVVNRVRVGTESYDEDELILVTSLSDLDGLIENTATVAGTQQVDFTLTNRSTGETRTATTDVSLDGTSATFERFGLGSWSNATGYYDYEIETEDDRFTGTIQIVPAAEAYPDAQNPEYISIDMNVITFE